MEIHFFSFFVSKKMINQSVYVYAVLVGIETRAYDGFGHSDGAVVLGVYSIVEIGVVSIGRNH